MSFAAPSRGDRHAITNPDPTAAQRAADELAHGAVDLGAAGLDPVYGWGLVGMDLAPAARLVAGQAR